MYFYKNLYVGPSVKDPDEVRRKLLIGEGQFTIYVIALSPSKPGPGANQLEIMHCANLKNPYYKKYPPYIIGIASGSTEAIEMVRELVQEAYEHTGSADVRTYLFPHGVRVIREKTPALKALESSIETVSDTVSVTGSGTTSDTSSETTVK